MSQYLICLTTVNSRRTAEKIATQLVKKRLIACANIVPSLISFYHWEGKLCRDAEVLILMKTKKGLVRRLEKTLQGLHPYELPEFIVLPITDGSQKYLAWIESQLTKYRFSGC